MSTFAIVQNAFPFRPMKQRLDGWVKGMSDHPEVMHVNEEEKSQVQKLFLPFANDKFDRFPGTF